MTPIDPTARNGIGLDAVTTETLAAACRTAAVSSAHADLLNAVAARMLAMLSWIDGAKVDLDGYDEARAAIARARALCEQVIANPLRMGTLALVDAEAVLRALDGAA